MTAGQPSALNDPCAGRPIVDPRRHHATAPESLIARYLDALARFANDSTVTGIDIGYHPDDDVTAPARPLVVRKHTRGGVKEIEPHDMKDSESDADALPIVTAQYVLFDADATAPSAFPTEAFPPSEPVQAGTGLRSRGSTRPGTLGLFVSRSSGEDTGIFALSCAHVLGRRSGCEVSTMEVAGSDGIIGTTTEDAANARGDWGLAAIDQLVSHDPTQRHSNALVRRLGIARIGDRLTKCGNATQTTCGIVDGIGRYFLDQSDSGRCGVDGFRVVPFPRDRDLLCNDRDSGAVWYRDTESVQEGVGLHTGRSDHGGKPRSAIASHLVDVLRSMDVVPVTEPRDGTAPGAAVVP